MMQLSFRTKHEHMIKGIVVTDVGTYKLCLAFFYNGIMTPQTDVLTYKNDRSIKESTISSESGSSEDVFSVCYALDTLLMLFDGQFYVCG